MAVLFYANRMNAAEVTAVCAAFIRNEDGFIGNFCLHKHVHHAVTVVQPQWRRLLVASSIAGKWVQHELAATGFSCCACKCNSLVKTHIKTDNGFEFAGCQFNISCLCACVPAANALHSKVVKSAFFIQ